MNPQKMCGNGYSYCHSLTNDKDTIQLCVETCFFNQSQENAEQPNEYWHPTYGCVPDCFGIGMYYPYELVTIELDTEGN